MKRKILIGVAILVVVLIAAVVAVPYLVPVGWVKDQVVAGVNSATGRDLQIKGPIKVNALPTLAVELQDVAFSNAAGAKHKDMATLKSLQVALKWLPLIFGRAEIDRFVLVDPVIHLEVDKQGKANWDFGGAKAAAPSAPAGGGSAPVSEINLGDVRLVNGLFTYDDASTGASYKIEQANMKLDLPSIDSKFAAKGDLVYNSKKIDIAVDAGKLRDLLEGRLTPVNLSVGGDPLKLAFKGQAATGKALKVDGDLDLAVPSVKELAAWAGSPIEAREKTMGPLSIKGKVGVTGPRYSFSNAQIALDEIKSTGEVSVDTAGARPALKGKLDIAALDVNPYLPPEAPPAKDQQAAGPTEWSSDPIDVAALKAADAEFDLSVGSLKVRKIEVGKSAIAALLRNGRLQVDLKEMALYDGKGQGRVVLDGSGATPAIEQSFNLQGIQVGPLLKAATDSERLTGKGTLDYAANGRGKSQKEIVSSLAGQGKIDFRDGAIKGFDLAEIVQAARDVKSAVTGGMTGSTKQTDFSELTGTFKIVNGIVSNDDLQMKSPLLRVTGKGTVEMPPKTVNYRLEPKVAATTKGQGGKDDATGITVPVIVSGPWHNISYRPDLEGMLKDAATGKALDALKGAVPVPGGSSGTGTTTPSAPSLPNPLKGILGK